MIEFQQQTIRLIASSTVSVYFGAVNDASAALYTFITRGARVSSTRGAKLQREHRDQKNVPPPCAPNYNALHQCKQHSHTSISIDSTCAGWPRSRRGRQVDRVLAIGLDNHVVNVDMYVAVNLACHVFLHVCTSGKWPRRFGGRMSRRCSSMPETA
jgi:hypothetical protein